MKWIIRNIDLALINTLIVLCCTILSGICFGWAFTIGAKKIQPQIVILVSFIGYVFINYSIKIFLDNKKTVRY